MTNLDLENQHRYIQSPNSALKNGKGIKKFFSGALNKFKQIFNKKTKSFSNYKYQPFPMIGNSRPSISQNLDQKKDSRSNALENVNIIIQFDKINEIVRFI